MLVSLQLLLLCENKSIRISIFILYYSSFQRHQTHTHMLEELPVKVPLLESLHLIQMPGFHGQTLSQLGYMLINLTHLEITQCSALRVYVTIFIFIEKKENFVLFYNIGWVLCGLSKKILKVYCACFQCESSELCRLQC